MTCKKHPKYGVIRKPRSACEACWFMWLEKRGWIYWLIEAKRLFSVVLLNFQGKSREAYHTHAFNSISWLLKGRLYEHMNDGTGLIKVYDPSWRPIITRRHTFHKVDSDGDSWVLSFRGHWRDTWAEELIAERRSRVLTHGRVEVK